jgi:hypothetical protein
MIRKSNGAGQEISNRVRGTSNECGVQVCIKVTVLVGWCTQQKGSRADGGGGAPSEPGLSSSIVCTDEHRTIGQRGGGVQRC